MNKVKLLTIIMTLIISMMILGGSSFAECNRTITKIENYSGINSEIRLIDDKGNIKEVDDHRNIYYGYADWIYNTNILTSNNSMDFYLFTISGEKTMVCSLQTLNIDCVAVICPYNPYTGDIYLTDTYIVTSNNALLVNDFNSSGQNTFCVMVLVEGNITETQYTIALNAKNSDGAISVINTNPDFSSVVVGYSENIYKYNNENILIKVTNFLNNTLPETGSGVIYETDENNIYIKLECSLDDLSLDSMEYGIYTNLNSIYYHTIKIPISGGTYWYGIGNCRPVQGVYVPDGYVVYDLETNSIIDWASPLNTNYNPYSQFYYGFYNFNSLLML